MLGRKRLPRHLEAPLAELRVVIAILGEASDALTSCVPTSRLPGRSLPDGLAEFEEHLRKAVERMPGWRGPEVEVEWMRAREAIGEALGQAERPRTQGPSLAGFQALVGAIDHLLAPLEAFETAARRFRELRT